MTLEDIPRGSFVCSYIGRIVNDEIANRTGLDFGDNYLAELDYIGNVQLFFVLYIVHV